jgi:hypothetical protein
MVGRMDGRIDEDVVHAAPHFSHVDERHAAVGLGVEIDEQRLAIAHRQCCREIDRGRRFTDASFLIGYRENHRCGSIAV